MKTNIRTLMTSLVVASAAVMGAAGIASASDEWFTLGEQTLSSNDPSVEIMSTGGRWDKDVKQVRLSVDGADVQISKVVLHWDNRKNDEFTDVGIVKSGGQTAPKNAPGIKGRLSSVTVQYTILGGATTANLKVLGYD